ncbi:MAG: sulfatase-like hydrolase/transferase [Verrucomicrobiota bacterium]
MNRDQCQNQWGRFVVAMVMGLLFFAGATSGFGALKPNIIIILIDDLGYGDIGPYGATKQKTPHLDRMAAEGMKLTTFCTTAPVCSPSRASIQTGSYYKRVNFDKVILPDSNIGLNPKETTLAELVKPMGYSTRYIGKWHLGDQKVFLPTMQGYDSYYGHPYSPDMPTIVRAPRPPNRVNVGRGDNQVLPIVEDTWLAEQMGYINPLTERYTEMALDYITEQAKADQRFFLFLSHMSVHEPVSPGDDWKGTSDNGKYGDAVQQLDWSTGEILQRLRDLGIDRDTLVFYTSDNGPAPSGAGTAYPLRGTKHTTWEGGVRVNALFWWPGTIPAGVENDALTTTMDLFPTIAHLTGGTLPDVKLDGYNIWPIIMGESRASPYDVFYYYRRSDLVAVRSGKWKFHILTPDKKRNVLNNLEVDPAETTDVTTEHPEVVMRLQALAQLAREDMGDGNDGPGVRPIGTMEGAMPFIMPHGLVRPDARPPMGE